MAHFGFPPHRNSYALSQDDKMSQDDVNDVEEDEEEINIDDALAAIVEDRPVIGVRRSARLQQGSANRIDHRLAEILQEEILRGAVLPST